VGTAAWITIIAFTVVVLPASVGWIAGIHIPPGDSYRSTPALAWICSLLTVLPVLLVGYATTPQSQCGGTGCDTSYGLGAVFIALLIYAPALVGTALGRRHVRRKSQQAAGQ
jgi:hypothetical protein